MSGVMLLAGGSIPTQPPVESAVAPNYERFDGLDPLATDGFEVTPFGQAYGSGPRPGTHETHGPKIGGIPGKVGSVGASPLPVDDPLHPYVRDTVKVSYLSTQFRLGPGGQAPGLAKTIASTELINNPPQPGDLSTILSGWG